MLPLRNRTRQLAHLLNRVRLKQVLVVQMIKEDIESLLCIEDLGTELRWCARLDALHFRVEDLQNWLRLRRDVGAVARCCAG